MKNKVLIIVLSIIAIIILCASGFSIYKIQVINPISSCFGMLEILNTDKEYNVVQNLPYKVMLINSRIENKTPYDILEEYMNVRGFTQLKDEQMGTTLVFKKDNTIEKVDYTVNGYYAKCVWK